MHVSFHLAHCPHPYYGQPPLHISPHYRIWLQILTPRQMISHVKSLTHVKPHHTTSFDTCAHIPSCHLTAVHPFVPHTYRRTLITPRHIANATHHVASYVHTHIVPHHIKLHHMCAPTWLWRQIRMLIFKCFSICWVVLHCNCTCSKSIFVRPVESGK